MSFILNIDTATESASISLSGEYKSVLGSMENKDQKDHASWIHSAIQQLLKENNVGIQQLQAVAVIAGPGSYTGLRVGMATAKGLCYSLGIPLIVESTLRVMALAAIDYKFYKKMDVHGHLYCPMIDARRMEVFTAVYDSNLQEIVQQQPMVLDERSFAAQLETSPVVFFGSGSNKFRPLTQHPNAVFMDIERDPRHLAGLSRIHFRAGKFADPAYAEPVYLKEFYTHTKK